eukprot:s2329_g7.t1
MGSRGSKTIQRCPVARKELPKAITGLIFGRSSRTSPRRTAFGLDCMLADVRWRCEMPCTCNLKAIVYSVASG